MKCTVYNFITGRIVGHVECDYIDQFMQAQTDEEHVHMGEWVDAALWYMPDGVKTTRPVFQMASEHTIAADGVDAVEIPLPAGTQIESLPDGELWPDEDELYFSTEEKGDFSFRVYLPFPYQDPFKVTIHAS